MSTSFELLVSGDDGGGCDPCLGALVVVESSVRED